MSSTQSDTNLSVERSLWRSSSARTAIVSAGARIAILPLTGITSIALARTVTGQFGVEAYAVFSLIVSLPLLVPVIDLGLGASVTNAAASLPSGADNLVAVIRRAWRYLVGGCVICLISVNVIGALQLWPALLGVEEMSGVNGGISVALSVFLFTMPASIGYSVLVGLKRNPLAIVMQGLAPIFSGLVVIAASRNLGLSGIVSISMVGIPVAAWLALIVALRLLRSRGLHLFSRGQSLPSPSLLVTAGPMLIIVLTMPFAIQGGRLILSFRGTLVDVAVYSAAMIAFLPVFSIAQVAGRSLWGEYASDRANRQSSARRFVTGIFTGATIGLSGFSGLVIAGPFVTKLAVGDAIKVPGILYWLLGGVVLVQALHLVSGMYLTDARGLRFQAQTTVLTAIVVTVLTLLLVDIAGALAPAISLLLGLTLCQFLPCLVHAISRLSVRERWLSYVYSGGVDSETK